MDKRKRYEVILKASLKDFNLPPEFCEQIAHARAKWCVSSEREQTTMKPNESVKLKKAQRAKGS